MSSGSKQPASPNTDRHDLHEIFSGWLRHLPPIEDVEEPAESVEESEARTRVLLEDAVPSSGRNLQLRISSADTKASSVKDTGWGGRRQGSGRKPAGAQLFKQFVAGSEAEAVTQELEMSLEERKAARAAHGRQARSQMAMQRSMSDIEARKTAVQSGHICGVLSRAISHQCAREDALYSMTPLQKHMLHLAEEVRHSKQVGSFDEEKCPQTWSKLLTTKINVASRRALAGTLGEAETTLTRRTAQAAAAVINGTGIFTLALTNWLRSCQESGSHRLVLMIKKRRYDETPSKITIPTHEGDTAPKESATAQIMQSEFSLRFLWQDLHSGSYHSWCIQIPTWLQVMDRTTAEVTRATQIEIERTVADLERLSNMYELSVSLVNTDRYASNMKAERSIAHDQPKFVHCHYGCDAHAAARVVSHQFKKIDPHISGMIASALAMQEAGSTKVFQECISQILEDRLVLQYGAPSEECMRHTIAVLNLFLPLPENIHTGQRVQSKKISLQRLQKQRAILLFFMNGDITDETQVQFYTASWNPDRHRVLNAMNAFLVPALCPCKPQLLSRKSWTGGDSVLSYFGILCSFRNIFTPAVQLYTNMTAKPEVPLENPVTLQAALESLGGSVPEEPGPAPMVLEDAVAAGEQNPDNTGTGTGTEAFATGNIDWSEINRNMKRRFFAWAECKPRDTIIVAKFASLRLSDFTFLLYFTALGW